MRNIERGIVLMNKSFRNKLFICFLLMLLITGCGKKEVENENLIEKEADETDRGKESPLAVYGGEQGRPAGQRRVRMVSTW